MTYCFGSITTEPVSSAVFQLIDQSIKLITYPLARSALIYRLADIEIVYFSHSLELNTETQKIIFET